MKRKITNVIENNIENNIINKPIDEIISYLKELIEKNPLYYSMYLDAICYDSCIEMSVYGSRIETDKEYENRLNREKNKKERDEENAKKSKERMKENRYKRYLELKKEFEGKNK
ncbi:MAG: hypothetical protein WC554_12045 [Clostridia bacterium]